MVTKNKIFKIFATSRNKKPKVAYSLVELSIVIVILALLSGGIYGAGVLVKNFRVATAQSATQNSVVNSIPDTALWLESSLDKSFNSTESSDGLPLSAWYDIKNSNNKINATIDTEAVNPTYSNTINYVQAVKFGGFSNSFFTIPNANFLNGVDYTIFVLEQRESNIANSYENYFLGDSNDSTANQSLLLGYSSNGQVLHSHSGAISAAEDTNAYSSSVESYEDSSNKPRVFAFIHDAVLGKKTYINGTLSAKSSNTDKLSNISSLTIGKGYKGQIGEIIIFSKALKSEERKSVEDYLSKKWSIKNNRDTSPECTGGVVTSRGCVRACPIRINGVSTTQVLDGANGSLSCNATGYLNPAQPINYSCNNGSLSLTPSSPTCPCDTINGYTLDGTTQACKKSCAVIGTGTTAGVSPTNVLQGNGTLSCSADGYDSSVSIAYTCNNGSLSISGSCNRCASGYAFAYDGTCKTTCPVTGVTGATPSPVAQTSGITGSISCNDSGYGGSVSYGCDSNGNFTFSGTCSCASGYAKIADGTCKTTCNISNVTGISATEVAQTGASASGSLTCNQAGYTGSVSYSCAANGSYTTSGSCGCDTTSGYMLDSGICKITCAVSGINGVSATAVLQATNQPLTCDMAGYTGSVSYTCATGRVFSYSGACGCSAGYSKPSGQIECKKQCTNITSVIGISPATYAGQTSTASSLACNAAGYSGSIFYTCTASGNSDPTFNLASGTCSCAVGYAKIANGTCQPTCTISNVTGINAAEVAQASASSPGSVTCNQTGYAGSVSYTCAADRSYTTSGSCGCDTASGYVMDSASGTCKMSCAVTGVDGISTTSVFQATSQTLTCDMTGYTGSITYSCTAGRVFSSSGACSCSAGYSRPVGQTACKKQCNITSTAGISSLSYVTQISTATSLTCSDTGYTGSISYTCIASGSSDPVFTKTSGACTCNATGYELSGGVCKSKCAISSGQITGMNATSGSTISNGSGSLTCTATGYSGSINYTCDNGALTITGGQCLPPCTGGTVTILNGSFIHTFTSSGTLSCSNNRTIQLLVAAGGGGGAGSYGQGGGSGGGGGGLIYNASYAISAGNHTITIGSNGINGGIGGLQSSGLNGGNGGNSSFDNLIAIGGGGGGSYNKPGNDGGSGGAPGFGGGTALGGTGITGQGFNGRANINSGNQCSGGAGGASQTGTTPESGRGGRGGHGLQINISGTATYYSGGGGGSCSNSWNNGVGPGISGSGGGTSSYGGGGGGVGRSSNGSNGGPGIVIIRY